MRSIKIAEVFPFAELGLEIDVAFWAGSRLSAFGSRRAQSGLSGHDPLADVLEK